MDVKYDVGQYVASIRMSAKTRILVEGKDDKSHISNLLMTILGRTKIKIDTAENIRGSCANTAKNNRAKLDKIHSICKGSDEYRNLHFLCDREYLKFNVGMEIEDLMNDHESDGNLSWTIGHSLENYFIDSNLLTEAFSYLSGSEFKLEAIRLFEEVLPQALKIVAAITLSARDIQRCTYPAGKIQWRDFKVSGKTICLECEGLVGDNSDPAAQNFIECLSRYYQVVEKTSELICSRICRGHTSLLMLQRIFSACIYSAGSQANENLSRSDANYFGNIRESSISAALSEAWLRSIKNGCAAYPTNLLRSVQCSMQLGHPP